jgi:O-antigen/teichoic acid export membrane protein
MNIRYFFKHAAIYGLANVLLYAGSFVLLPLYTWKLHPGDYGVLEILGRLAETFGTCMLFGGFRQALLTFYQQNQDAERERLVSSTLALVLGTCLLGGGLLMVLADPLSGVFRTAEEALNADLFRLAILGILLEPFTLIPLSLMQSRVESVTFVLITISQFVLRVSLCLILVAWLNWGVRGVLTATAVTAGIYGIPLSVREVLRRACWPDWKQVCALMRFALPFLPGGLCFLVLHHGDRYFLLHYWGTEEVGTYALGYKLAMVVTMFSLNPLYMVWSVHLYEVARSPAAPEAFGAVFTRIMAAYLLAGLGLGVFQDELVARLGWGRYAGAAPVVAPVLLACFFQAGASLMDAGFYVRRRTDLKLGITLAATAVMLVLYVTLIPPFGGAGAALATLVGFAFLAVCTWWVTQRVFPVRYEWPRLFALLTLTVSLWLVSRWLPAAVWAIPMKAGLIAVGPLLAWLGGLISNEEKEYLLSFVRQARVSLADGIARLRAGRDRQPATPTEEESIPLDVREREHEDSAA